MTRKEERIQRAIQYANEAQVESFNCGQGSLAGLLKEFKEDIGITDIEADALLKANSKTWGLGGHGGTCGTVQGPIHFLGYVYGENQTGTPFNMAATMKMLKRVNVITEFTEKILKERGSTNCRDFHIQMFQKYYDLNIDLSRVFVKYNPKIQIITRLLASLTCLFASLNCAAVLQPGK